MHHCRDECPDTGMLVVIEAVLMELHRGIIAALGAASPVGFLTPLFRNVNGT